MSRWLVAGGRWCQLKGERGKRSSLRIANTPPVAAPDKMELTESSCPLFISNGNNTCNGETDKDNVGDMICDDKYGNVALPKLL
jgi:hypothetical protein